MLGFWLLSIDIDNSTAAQWLLGLTFALAMILLVTPGCMFLWYGAASRKNEIIGSLGRNGAYQYLRCFQPNRATVINNAQAEFRRFYDSEFSRSRYILPSLVCYACAAVLGWGSTITALSWLRGEKFESGLIPPNAVLAFIGGYTWVTYDQILRSMRADLTPRSQLIGAFRLLIAIPLGYAIGLAFNPALAGPIALLLGMFPTNTVMVLGRRGLVKLVGNPDLPQDAQSELQCLSSVDIAAAERFSDEGVTSILQLAYADPVRLVIRTNLGFSYIIGCSSEALLWLYLESKTKLLRPFGISGAYECRSVWEDIGNQDDPIAQNRATSVVVAIAKVLELSTVEAVYNLLKQVAEDPYTIFQWACWAENFQPE